MYVYIYIYIYMHTHITVDNIKLIQWILSIFIYIYIYIYVCIYIYIYTSRLITSSWSSEFFLSLHIHVFIYIHMYITVDNFKLIQWILSFCITCCGVLRCVAGSTFTDIDISCCDDIDITWWSVLWCIAVLHRIATHLRCYDTLLLRTAHPKHDKHEKVYANPSIRPKVRPCAIET